MAKKEDIILELLDSTFENEKIIKDSKRVICLHCGKAFDSSEITDFVDWSFNENAYRTAICPNCLVDALVGDASDYVVDEKDALTVGEKLFDEKDENDEDTFLYYRYQLIDKSKKRRKLIEEFFRNEKSKTTIKTVLNALYKEVQHGNTLCMIILCDLFYIGHLVNKDDKKAHYYASLADERGDKAGTIRLGYIYNNGLIDPKRPEYEKAFECFSKVAISDSHHKDKAILHLADMYSRGHYVKMDKDFAKELIIPMIIKYNHNNEHDEYFDLLGDSFALASYLFSPETNDVYDIERYWNYTKLAHYFFSHYDFSNVLTYGRRHNKDSLSETLKEIENELIYNENKNINYFEFSDINQIFEMIFEFPSVIDNLVISNVDDDLHITLSLCGSLIAICEIDFIGIVEEITFVIEKASLKEGEIAKRNIQYMIPNIGEDYLDIELVSLNNKKTKEAHIKLLSKRKRHLYIDHITYVDEKKLVTLDNAVKKPMA